MKPTAAQNISEVPGRGATGTVDGRVVTVGRLPASAGTALWADAAVRRARLDLASLIWVSVDEVPVAALLVRDRVRTDAARTMRRLRAAGLHRLLMLTGDRVDNATEVARLLGLSEVLADADPAASRRRPARPHRRPGSRLACRAIRFGRDTHPAFRAGGRGVVHPRAHHREKIRGRPVTSGADAIGEFCTGAIEYTPIDLRPCRFRPGWGTVNIRERKESTMLNLTDGIAPSYRAPTRRRARSRVGTSGMAVLAAIALTSVAAPDASAVVTGLNVTPGSPGMSVGITSRYGTNCTYTLTATVNDYHPVVFYDSTGAAAFYPSSTINPSFDVHTLRGEAIVSWTPTKPGWHHIYANQPPYAGPAVSLLVGNGVNTGSACLVLP